MPKERMADDQDGQEQLDLERQIDTQEQDEELDDKVKAKDAASDEGDDGAQEQDDGDDTLAMSKDSDAEDHDDEDWRKKRNRNGAARRAKMREKLRSLEAQNQELSASYQQLVERLSRIETGHRSTQMAQLAKRIEDADRALADARAKRKEALAVADADQIDAAEELIYQARREKEMLLAFKEQAERGGPQGGQRAPDPTEARLVQSWVDKNKWYDPQLRDRDSRRARFINDELLSEGYRPNTPAFWAELDNRLAEVLPNRGKTQTRAQEHDDLDDEDADDTPPPRREARQDTRQGDRPPAMVGGGRDSTKPLNKNGSGFMLSSERRKALLEAGFQPGTPEWKEQVANFQQYDRNRRAEKRA